jgi:hypothetical protein
MVEFRTCWQRPNSDRFKRSFWVCSSSLSCQFWVQSCRRSLFLFPNSSRLWCALRSAWCHVENRPVGVKRMRYKSLVSCGEIALKVLARHGATTACRRDTSNPSGRGYDVGLLKAACIVDWSDSLPVLSQVTKQVTKQVTQQG